VRYHPADMAPQVFISYSHDNQEHMDRLWDLSERLRRDGVDCRIDQQEESPAEGWPRWCKHEIRDADFVLVACTENYRPRYEGEEGEGVGLGGQWEGYVITQRLYRDQGRNTKFIPILFSGSDSQYIPDELDGVSRYDLSKPDGYEKLFRRVTEQPERKASPVAAEVRKVPTLAPLERKSPSPKAGVTGPSPYQLFTVAFPENPFFTGREEILEGVKATLENSGIAALTGMGGVGKTQTAAQYAYRHREDYPAVLWLRAESLDTLFSDLSQLAARLELPEREAKEQSVSLDAVKRWLDEQERWLLVLDNVEDYGIVRDLTRKADAAKGHHIIVTTQTQAMGAVGKQRLFPMERDQGALLLLRRAQRLTGDNPLSSVGSQEAALAREIADEVGGLPLALDQAGAYIEETACGLADYLKVLRERSQALLDRRGGLDSDHRSVAKTFLMSFEKLQKMNPAAAELLQAAAFLLPDAIPEEIFITGAAQFGPELSAAAADPLKWNDAIACALKFSLLERDPEKKLLAVHRMVQAVLKSRMTEEERKALAEQEMRAVNAAFPYPEFENWAQCERLVPSAQLCAALVDEHRLSSDEAARLLNAAGYYLRQRARNTEAEPLYQSSLSITQALHGPDHPEVAIRLNNLAALLQATNRLAEAEPLMRRALDIDERAYGSDHPDVAVDLNNLAQLLQATNRLKEAEPLMRRALDIDERAYGPNHPTVAIHLNNLARLLQDTNRLSEAEPLMRRALEIDERAYGPDHPNVAIRLNNLAGWLKGTNRLEEAEPLLRRVVDIFEKVYGSDHPSVATSLNNLAQLLKATNRLAEAEPLMRRALGIDERAYGPDHPHVAIRLSNLAVLLQDTNRLEEAEPLMRRALDIGERAHGPNHPNVAIRLNNLAQLLQATNRLEGAEPLMRRALEIFTRSLGTDHPNTVTVRNNFVLLLREMGKNDEADSLG
jgi:tetratricopeptide (TPR) repeat protein